MVSPNFLGLPVFSNFDLVFKLSLVFEIVLCSWHAIPSAIGIVEYVLAFGHVLVPFIFPQDCSSIITSTCEESADCIPSDAVNRLFVIAELS